MKLLPKFALLSIGVAVVPLAIAGYSSARISQGALRQAIEEHELMVARQVAEFVSNHLGNLQATLAIETRVLDLTGQGSSAPSPELLRKFLQFVYHQNDDFSAVAALDVRGESIVPPAWQQAPRAQAAFGNHEAMRSEDLVLFKRLTPILDVLQEGTGIGPVFLAGSAHKPHTLLAVKVEPAAPQEEPQVIAAQISLRRMDGYLATLASPDSEILLLDRESRVVASSAGTRRLSPKPVPAARAKTLPHQEMIAEYRDGGRLVIGAYAPASAYRMGVLVERSLESALSPVRRLGWATVYWMSISALVAAVVGAALARTLSGRVGALAQGARRIAQGKLDTQLEVPSRDELGELAQAFNAMATSLDAARHEILRQTDEIVVWNQTLERRVEEKTKELREAQDLLLRSRSLAAIGSLGAGVAHEINNPLTGVLGLAQLLLSDLPEDHPARPMVTDIVTQATRIQGIVSNLLRLAQKQAREDFQPLDLSRVVDDALELCGLQALSEAGVQVVRRIPSPSPPIRGSAVQLQAALIQLIQNAQGAMGGGGTLTLETSAPEPKILRLRVCDTGRGIKPEVLPRIFDPFFTTKERRTDTGIGLSVVHKIIEDHGGTIRVESEVGRGTTFWLTFPIDQGASHLA